MEFRSFRAKKFPFLIQQQRSSSFYFARIIRRKVVGIWGMIFVFVPVGCLLCKELPSRPFETVVPVPAGACYCIWLVSKRISTGFAIHRIMKVQEPGNVWRAEERMNRVVKPVPAMPRDKRAMELSVRIPWCRIRSASPAEDRRSLTVDRKERQSVIMVSKDLVTFATDCPAISLEILQH